MVCGTIHYIYGMWYNTFELKRVFFHAAPSSQIVIMRLNSHYEIEYKKHQCRRSTHKSFLGYIS